MYYYPNGYAGSSSSRTVVGFNLEGCSAPYGGKKDKKTVSTYALPASGPRYNNVLTCVIAYPKFLVIVRSAGLVRQKASFLGREGQCSISLYY